MPSIKKAEYEALLQDTMDLIIVHKNCPDGWCSAVIAHKRFPEAEILPLDHGSPIPIENVRGKDVLVLDFSWRTREENIQLSKLAKSFRILDHHKTAQAVLEGLPFAKFDMQRSGAGLAWDYLFGTDSSLMVHPEGLFIENAARIIQPRPWYVDYVEERDLWRNDGKGFLPNSREVNAYIMTLPMTLDDWAVLDMIDADHAAVHGQGALAQVNNYVREAIKQARRGHLSFNGKSYTVSIVNALYMNISEVGHALVEAGADIGMGFFERHDNVMQFSLRSQGDTDVSAIAKLLNGGGHRNAAGFQLSIEDGRRLVDSLMYRNFDVTPPATPVGLEALPNY